MLHAGTSDSLQSFVENATRFWLAVATDDRSEPPLTAAQEALARRFIDFLRNTEPEEAQAVLLLLDAFERRRRR